MSAHCHSTKREKTTTHLLNGNVVEPALVEREVDLLKLAAAVHREAFNRQALNVVILWRAKSQSRCIPRRL